MHFTGNQSRPEIFDLRISKPDLLYERVVEVDERIAVLKDGDMHAATIANPAYVPRGAWYWQALCVSCGWKVVLLIAEKAVLRIRI